MLAISVWAWGIAGAFAFVSMAILIKVTINLIRRIKDLTRTLSGASGDLNGALGSMREDLERTSGGLASLRSAQEDGFDDRFGGRTRQPWEEPE